MDSTPSYCTSVKWLALVSSPQFVWVRWRLYGRGPYLPQPPVLTCVCFLGKIHFYKDMLWQTRGFSLLLLSVVGSLFGKRSRSGWVCLFNIFLYVLLVTVGQMKWSTCYCQNYAIYCVLIKRKLYSSLVPQETVSQIVLIFTLECLQIRKNHMLRETRALQIVLTHPIRENGEIPLQMINSSFHF